MVGGDAKDNDPVASPTADVVAFRRLGPEPGLWSATLPDGGSPKRLTLLGDDHDPTWSQDGSRLVFVRRGDLWMMNADGSDQRQLSDDNVEISAPTWSTR